MIDYKLIGSRLKEARECKGITQEFLAEQASITVVYLSKIENGKVHPTLEVLHALCLHLDCDLGGVLGNSSSESAAYQQEKVNQIFQSLSPAIQPIAIDLLEGLSKIK